MKEPLDPLSRAAATVAVAYVVLAVLGVADTPALLVALGIAGLEPLERWWRRVRTPALWRPAALRPHPWDAWANRARRRP